MHENKDFIIGTVFLTYALLQKEGMQQKQVSSMHTKVQTGKNSPFGLIIAYLGA